MAKIQCNVTNCSHNNNTICFANRVNINGGMAKDTRDTNCSSFLDEAHYGSLTNNTNNYGHGDACTTIVCEAYSCSYNNNKLCYADGINVTGGKSNLYEETHCGTFKRQ